MISNKEFAGNTPKYPPAIKELTESSNDLDARMAGMKLGSASQDKLNQSKQGGSPSQQRIKTPEDSIRNGSREQIPARQDIPSPQPPARMFFICFEKTQIYS
jgi:hypothetical protein